MARAPRAARRRVAAPGRRAAGLAAGLALALCLAAGGWLLGPGALSAVQGVAAAALGGNGPGRAFDAAVAAADAQTAAEALEGRATATDGDTLRLRPTGGGAVVKIRLHGLDAPESAQSCRDAAEAPWPCGAAATGAMAALVAAGPVRCLPEGGRSYDRIVARCFAADGRDLAESLVAQGLAIAYRRFSERYVPAEIDAFKAGRGIWAGRFTPPQDWRRGARLAEGGGVSPTPEAAAKLDAGEAAQPIAAGAGGEGCAIKGNISANGRIYHLPGQVDYARTRISTGRGERWFCSEQEALAAGWRRAAR